jgi:FtsH-binding integral membrane protein
VKNHSAAESMKPRCRQWLSTLKDFILETLKLMAIALLLMACGGVLINVRDDGLFAFVGYSIIVLAAIAIICGCLWLLDRFALAIRSHLARRRI